MLVAKIKLFSVNLFRRSSMLRIDFKSSSVNEIILGFANASAVKPEVPLSIIN